MSTKPKLAKLLRRQTVYNSTVTSALNKMASSKRSQSNLALGETDLPYKFVALDTENSVKHVEDVLE